MNFLENLIRKFAKRTLKNLFDKVFESVVDKIKDEIEESDDFKPKEKETLKRGVDLVAAKVYDELDDYL